MCKECNEIITIPNLYKNGEEVKLWISNSKPRVPFKYNVGYITSKNETIIKHIYILIIKSKLFAMDFSPEFGLYISFAFLMKPP